MLLCQRITSTAWSRGVPHRAGVCARVCVCVRACARAHVCVYAQAHTHACTLKRGKECVRVQSTDTTGEEMDGQDKARN